MHGALNPVAARIGRPQIELHRQSPAGAGGCYPARGCSGVRPRLASLGNRPVHFFGPELLLLVRPLLTHPLPGRMHQLLGLRPFKLPLSALDGSAVSMWARREDDS